MASLARTTRMCWVHSISLCRRLHIPCPPPGASRAHLLSCRPRPVRRAPRPQPVLLRRPPGHWGGRPRAARDAGTPALVTAAAAAGRPADGAEVETHGAPNARQRVRTRRVLCKAAGDAQMVTHVVETRLEAPRDAKAQGMRQPRRRRVFDDRLAFSELGTSVCASV